MKTPEVLSHRNFRLLITGTGVSALGNAITPVALALGVLELGGNATQLGLVVASFALAEVITVLFGGVLGDRLPRALLMQGSALACALTQGVLAASFFAGWASLWLLSAIGMLNGCLGALSSPSSSAMTRQTVPVELLPDAVALRRLVQISMMVVGSSLGGLVVATAGAGWGIALDSVSFLAAACCFTLLRVAAEPTDTLEKSQAKQPFTLVADLREGASEVFRHTWLWLLIGQALIYHLFFGGVQGVLGPIVTEQRFGIAAWGWALGALMAGFLVGGLVSLRFRPHRLLYAGCLLLVLTACFPLAIALGGPVGWLLLGAFLHGFGLEIFSVQWDLAIQQNISEDKLARVYSFDLVGSFCARPLGLALTGPVAGVVGSARWLLWVSAVIAISCALALLSSQVRNLTRRPVISVSG